MNHIIQLQATTMDLVNSTKNSVKLLTIDPRATTAKAGRETHSVMNVMKIVRAMEGCGLLVNALWVITVPDGGDRAIRSALDHGPGSRN